MIQKSTKSYSKWIRPLLILAITLSLVISITACGGTGQTDNSASENTTANDSMNNSETSQDQPTEPVELRAVTFATGSSTGGPYFANIEIGKDLGFYAEEGIDPTFLHAGGNAAATAELEAGRALFAVGTPNFEVTYFADTGSRPGVNFFEYTYPMKWDFAVMNDSDIQSVADLEGAVIGIHSLGTADELVARQWLKLGGVDPDGVEFVVTGGGMPAGIALQDGDVDAILAWDTHRGQYVVAGIDFRVLPRPEGIDQFGGFYLQTLDETLVSERDLVIGFGRAVAKGTVFALANPEAAMAIYLENHPEVGEGMTQEEAVQNLVITMQGRMANWANYWGGAQGEINPQEWVNEVVFAGLEDAIKDPTIFYTNELIDEINNFDHDAIAQMAINYDWKTGE